MHAHNGMFCSPKKERDPAICSNMGGRRGRQLSDISQPEKGKYYTISLVCGIQEQHKMSTTAIDSQTLSGCWSPCMGESLWCGGEIGELCKEAQNLNRTVSIHRDERTTQGIQLIILLQFSMLMDSNYTSCGEHLIMQITVESPCCILEANIIWCINRTSINNSRNKNFKKAKEHIYKTQLLMLHKFSK